MIENGDKITHEKSSQRIDQFLENNKPLLKKKFQIIDRFFDYSFTPVVQSGGEYNLKPTAESSNKIVSFDVVMVSLAGRYFDMNAHVARTLMINPSTKEQSCYLALLSLFEELSKNLRPGSTIGDAIGRSLESFKRKHAELVSHLPQSYGYGMGYDYKEKELLLTIRNTTPIEPGMTFNLVVSLENLNTDRAFPVSLQVADMMLVETDKTTNLTQQVSKDFKNVGYQIEEENDRPKAQ